MALFSITVPPIGARIQTVGLGARDRADVRRLHPEQFQLALGRIASIEAASPALQAIPGALLDARSVCASKYSASAVMKSGL